ncbi:MAG TPA: DUF4215 domain-containing protein [Kofleriaceae bacterium]|nr:DUF4215 domain-containing protein [Kofleriaceae bacterium]
MRLRVVALWVLVSWVAVFAGCGGEGDGGDGPEDCALVGDEDGNGVADCGDPVCAGTRECLPACGNGRLEAGERCDDGNVASGDGCDASCTPTACGNGVLTRGEGCDDGNAVDGDGCDSNCVVTGCGNGVVTSGEACDDGNAASGDGCDANCTPTGCGNGVLTGGEACDDGNAASGDGCDANCTLTGCGNGVVTGAEACDDGNATNGDGCDNNCTATACGNGVRTGTEQCDDGNATSGDGCDSNCTVSRCGNGIVAGTEVCDDGNVVSGDGCDANCTPTGCGNGVRTGTEQCDDGNAVSGDGCDANCTPTGCGNGVVTGAEECDDGNQVEGDGCTNACVVQVCGDGELDAPEVCDDGNAVSGDGCDANCTPTGCGNGVVTGGEACDDGNPRSLDGCSAACVIEPLEIEPNEDGSPSTSVAGSYGNDFATANADANGAFTGSVTIRGSITPAGDEDVFKFTNPGPGSVVVRLDVWDPARGIGVICGFEMLTLLVVRDASGRALESNYFRSTNDACSGLAFGLLPGASVYVHMMASVDTQPVASYALQAVYLPVTCGDGVKVTPETCDDGNTASGDGCRADCQIETVAEVEPNGTVAEAAASPVEIAGDATVAGSLATATDVDLHRIVVASPTVVVFETYTRLYSCDSRFRVRLFDALGALVVAGEEPWPYGSSCGSIAVYLAAGTYYLGIDQFSVTPVPQYFLVVDYYSDRGAEPEPPGVLGVNDSVATASPGLNGGNGVYVFGDHTLDNDDDFYTVTVPSWARMRAELVEGDRAVESCESNGIGSQLAIVDLQGRVLDANTDNGRGRCSLLDGTGTFPLNAYAKNPTSSPMTLTIRVRRSEAAFPGTSGASFVYRLLVSFR